MPAGEGLPAAVVGAEVMGAAVVGRSGSLTGGKADWAVRSTKFQPLSAVREESLGLPEAEGGGVAIRVEGTEAEGTGVEGTPLGANGTGSTLPVGFGFAAVGAAGGGGGKEGSARFTSPVRTALKVSATLPGAMNRVAIASVAKLNGRISPFNAAPTIAKTALSTQKLSNPSTLHLYGSITLL